MCKDQIFSGHKLSPQGNRGRSKNISQNKYFSLYRRSVVYMHYIDHCSARHVETGNDLDSTHYAPFPNYACTPLRVVILENLKTYLCQYTLRMCVQVHACVCYFWCSGYIHTLCHLELLIAYLVMLLFGSLEEIVTRVIDRNKSD